MPERNITKLEKRISLLSTALNNLESDFEEKVRELSLLRRLGDSLAYVFDLREACQKIVELIYRELMPDNCSLMLFNPDRKELELYALQSTEAFSREKNAYAPLDGKRFAVGEGAAGWAVEQRKIVNIPDTSRDERFVRLPDSRVTINSLICIPLLNHDKTEGVLNISYSTTGSVPRKRIHFFNILMRYAGLSVGSIRLHNELNEANRSLEESDRNAHELRDELYRTRQYIVGSDKLSGINILAAGIAHEFNNIFASILGYSELSLLSADLDEHRNCFNTIIKLSNRAAEMIDNLLDFAGQHTLAQTDVNLSGILRSILDLVKPGLKNNRITVKEKFAKIPAITGDRNQISRVFLHLISNAHDAMSDGGGTLTVSTKNLKGCAEITIGDTGKGIDPTIVDNIFDPFVTTKGAFGGGRQPGKGLGLSVAYGIVTSHGGTIEVSSPVGQGTTVTVRFPTSAAVTTDSES